MVGQPSAHSSWVGLYGYWHWWQRGPVKCLVQAHAHWSDQGE